MPTPLTSQEKAQKAYDLNLIRQDQLDAQFPKAPDFPETTVELPPAPVDMTLPGEALMYDDLGPQRAFWEQKKAKEEAAVAGAEQRRADFEAADIERRRQNAVKMGYTPQQIEAQLPAPIKPFQAPQQLGPLPLAEDPYLAADKERERQKQLLSEISLNYPGAAGYNAVEQGIKTQGQALREQSRAQADEYQKTMDALDSYQKDDKILGIAQNKRFEDAQKDLETMRADLASTKIQPKAFANASTGEKILAWSSLILGGFAGGGRNPAADALNRAVDREIETQKADYQTKKEGYENKQTMYAQMMNKFNNDRAAKAASKLDLYKKAELKLMQLSAKYTDAATQGKVQEQLGKLQIIQDQAKNDYLSAFMSDDPYKKMDEKQAQRYVPGYGFAPDPERMKLATTATAMADNTISNINTILTKAQKAGRFDIGANDEISGLVQLLRSESREAILGPGTVQAAERTLIEDMLKDPGAFFTNRAKAQKALEVIRDAAARTRDNKLKSYGVRQRAERFRSLEYDK